MNVTKIKTKEIYVDGELVGYADVIIKDEHGEFYGSDLGNSEYEKLQDNGEYVFVNGYGVEAK